MPFPGLAQSVVTDIQGTLEKDSVDDYNGEIQVLNSIILVQPDMARARYLHGKAKYQLKDYYGAIADLQRAAQLPSVLNRCTC